MAKCIRVVGQGVPVRLSDDDAFAVVRDGDGGYCAKEFWKVWYDGQNDREPKPRLISRLVGSKITATHTLHFNAQHSRKEW
jgi:hypothetical protein